MKIVGIKEKQRSGNVVGIFNEDVQAREILNWGYKQGAGKLYISFAQSDEENK